MIPKSGKQFSEKVQAQTKKLALELSAGADTVMGCAVEGRIRLRERASNRRRHEREREHEGEHPNDRSWHGHSPSNAAERFPLMRPPAASNYSRARRAEVA